MNNILFFLTPKAMCAFLYDDYTIRQALEKMEQAGAVFLPAAGNRAGTSVNFAGQLGIYWSFYDDGYTGTDKEYLHIEAGNVSIGIAPRNLGASVRLVKEI